MCPRHYAFFVAAVAIGEQQVKASLACIAADRMNFVMREHFEIVNFGCAAVWAGEVEAGNFRGFVKVHRHLAFTENTRETGSERRRYSAVESRCPECNCITTLPALFAADFAPGRQGIDQYAGWCRRATHGYRAIPRLAIDCRRLHRKPSASHRLNCAAEASDHVVVVCTNPST